VGTRAKISPPLVIAGMVGENHPFSRFSNADVEKMKKMRKLGMKYRYIGKAFGTTKQIVWDIINGKTRKHG
jgi:hypothetical protein